MDEREKAIIRQLYDLQVELFNYQGAEIEALHAANAALKRSHETIGEMLRLTGELLKVS